MVTDFEIISKQSVRYYNVMEDVVHIKKRRHLLHFLTQCLFINEHHKTTFPPNILEHRFPRKASIDEVRSLLCKNLRNS